MLNGWNGLTNSEKITPIPNLEDTLSDGSSMNSYNYESEEASAAAGIAAVYQLRDIESFIANVTVPPPPSRSSLSISEATDQDPLEDIAAFIIPPPPISTTPMGAPHPPSVSGLINSDRAIDREVNEVKVKKETREVKDKISPKIASIQQKFLNQHSDSAFQGLQDTLTRKKSPVDADLPPPPPPPRTSAPKKYDFGQQGQQPPRPSKLTLESVVQVKSTLSKMSLTSSSDSLSSNTSINTVKSVSPTKEDKNVEVPPSLPPRHSPSKTPSRPPLASPEDVPVSPPPKAQPMQKGSKPSVPSRASKPQLSPLRSLPPIPNSSGNGKAPAPAAPPTLAKSFPGTLNKKVKNTFIALDNGTK